MPAYASNPTVKARLFRLMLAGLSVFCFALGWLGGLVGAGTADDRVLDRLGLPRGEVVPGDPAMGLRPRDGSANRSG